MIRLLTLPLSSIEEEKCPNRPFHRWHRPLAFVIRPSLPLEAAIRKHSGLPYRFLFVQASMRSSAFSMFSIEFATLKRR